MARSAPPVQKAEAPPTVVITQAPAPAHVPAWPTHQAPAADAAKIEKPARRKAGGGLPVGPVLASTGNATAMGVTAAFQYGGPAGAITAGVAVAGAATVVALRKRSAVRRSMAARGGSRTASGGASGAASRGGSGAFRGGSGGGARGASGGGGRGVTAGWPSPSVAPARKGSASSPHGATSPTPKPPKAGPRSAHGAPTSSTMASRHGRAGGHAKPGKAHTLKAAIARTARAAAKPGSVPRKALAATGRAAKATGRGLKVVGRGAVAAGRKTAQAWKSKPAVATRRLLAKAARGALDGTVAAVSAGWTLLHARSWKAAGKRLLEVWRRRRAKKKSTTGASAAPEPAPVAASVRRPHTTTSSPATTHGGTMSGGHHFVAPAMEMARIAATYDPRGMLEVGEDFAGLAEALKLHAEAMKITVENADAKQPLDPRIVEIMRQIHGLQLKASELADELKPAFERLHDVDLSRLRNPRKGKAGEAMWDATTNL